VFAEDSTVKRLTRRDSKRSEMLRKVSLVFLVTLLYVLAAVVSKPVRGLSQSSTIAELLAASPSSYLQNALTSGAFLVNNSAGSIQLFDVTQNSLLTSVGLSTLISTLNKCGIQELHVQTDAIEYAYVVEGEGTFTLWSSNGSVVLLKAPLKPGDVAIIPAGWPHFFTGSETSTTPLVFVSTFTSGEPQVYFLAGAGNLFANVPSEVGSSLFNVTASQYGSFFRAESTVGVVFNETCLGNA
jgi:oxalate decarboxylase/phosphoglucose isomerase-like protein (cupin superfamily)